MHESHVVMDRDTVLVPAGARGAMAYPASVTSLETNDSREQGTAGYPCTRCQAGRGRTFTACRQRYLSVETPTYCFNRCLVGAEAPATLRRRGTLRQPLRPAPSDPPPQRRVLIEVITIRAAEEARLGPLLDPRGVQTVILSSGQPLGTCPGYLCGVSVRGTCASR